ncbi:hypothetical protein KC19_VG134500 [Ceratodon purpureus]|uniref:Uncharacterized protein n=1 Tax=Ceratodon purpureus TaxID=3225 RepID=A0A8T0HPU4_CERPU|nr:hypothetical protein KC19_VG134500 [Ceratodon purpureus]
MAADPQEEFHQEDEESLGMAETRQPREGAQCNPIRPHARVVPSHRNVTPLYTRPIQDLAGPERTPALQRERERLTRVANEARCSREDKEQLNKKRCMQNKLKTPYLAEMKKADAEQRSPSAVIPTSPAGEVIGLKTVLHNAVKTLARRCVNYLYRSYVGRKGEWKAVIDAIMMSLELVYEFPHPLSRTYVSKFLKGALADERKVYKAYFIANKGEQYSDMPDEAYLVWSEWWSSPEGKVEAADMKALHAMQKSEQVAQQRGAESEAGEFDAGLGSVNATAVEDFSKRSGFNTSSQVSLKLFVHRPCFIPLILFKMVFKTIGPLYASTS